MCLLRICPDITVWDTPDGLSNGQAAEGLISMGFGINGEMITTGTNGKIGVAASFQLAKGFTAS